MADRQNMAPGQFIYLRNRKAVIIHPPHRDRDVLVEHLGRIGMLVDIYWPLPTFRLGDTEFLFIYSEVGDDLASIVDGFTGQQSCVTVAIVESESPTLIMKTLSDSIDVVLTRPLRATGLLSTLCHALFAKSRLTDLSQKLATTQRKLSGSRQVEKAKEFLMATNSVSGDEAFAILRRYAMDERRSIEDVAKGILDAAHVMRRSNGTRHQ